MTEADLAEIAGKDQFEAEQHHKALRCLQRSMRVVGRLEWNPREAVELERWEVPNSVAGHRRRLFACAILFDSYFDEAAREYMDSLSDVLAPLVSSAVQLDPVAMSESRRSIAALIEMPFPWWEQHLLFAGLASVVLSAAIARGDEDSLVGQLVDWVLAEHLRLKLEGLSPDRGLGVLGTTFFDQYHSLWQSMAHKHLLEPDLVYSVETNAKLRELGNDIVGWIRQA